jgi:D-amino-acid oxidase
MSKDELPKGVILGMSCEYVRYPELKCLTNWPETDKTVVLTPITFLPWLAKRLKNSGVTFLRKNVGSLAELKSLGYDVLVNATGCGSKFLRDVADLNVQQVRGQTILVKTDYNKILMRHGKDYTYVIPRLDGTAILGGIKQVDNT